MSNCVNIHNTMAMPLSAIDADRLFHDMAIVNKSDIQPKNGNNYIIWWFLGLDNVYTDEDHLFINLGDHRSTHTWRDLRNTLNVIASYMHNKGEGASVQMILSDEYDNFETQGSYTFDLDNLWPDAA